MKNTVNESSKTIRECEGMFRECHALTEALTTGWDLSSITTMRDMFLNCASLESIGRDPGAFGQGETEGMFQGTPLQQSMEESSASQ